MSAVSLLKAVVANATAPSRGLADSSEPRPRSHSFRTDRIGPNSNCGYQPRIPRVRPEAWNGYENLKFIGGPGHAEENIANAAEGRLLGREWDIIEGGTSTTICPDRCAPILEFMERLHVEGQGTYVLAAMSGGVETSFALPKRPSWQSVGFAVGCAERLAPMAASLGGRSLAETTTAGLALAWKAAAGPGGRLAIEQAISALTGAIHDAADDGFELLGAHAANVTVFALEAVRGSGSIVARVRSTPRPAI